MLLCGRGVTFILETCGTTLLWLDFVIDHVARRKAGAMQLFVTSS